MHGKHLKVLEKNDFCLFLYEIGLLFRITFFSKIFQKKLPYFHIFAWRMHTLQNLVPPPRALPPGIDLVKYVTWISGYHDIGLCYHGSHTRFAIFHAR